ncbi:hypothetical protein AAY473_037488 [Plecturocebus cupreus]
MLARMVSIS